MKKTLSLLLVLAMVLGSFSFAFADEAKVDPAVEAGEFLKKAGVLEGSDSGDLMLDKQLKRQDAVVLLSRLMKAEEEAKKFPVTEEYPTFKDITNNYYKPYLAWAQANKYYEGHNAEKFGYGEFLTAQQYATVLLRALGYEVNDAEAYKAAFETAKKLGIMKDLKVEEKAEITRGQMAQMTFNALGLKMKGSDKTLAEFLGIEMPAPAELKVEKVETENLGEVVVRLSNAKLPNEAKLVDANNYKIVGRKIQKVTVDGNDVILSLDKPLVEKVEYELVIRNIDKAMNKTYAFTAKDNAIPVIKDVKVLGEYGIKVITSEPIDSPQERSFLIDGKNVAMQVEQYGREIILTPYHKTAFSENAKTLTIKSLKDYAGFKSEEAEFPIQIVKDEVAPEVTAVVVKGNVVEVTFDKDVYDDSVEAYWNRSSVGNISYVEGRHTIYAEKAGKIDTNKVAYTFARELPRDIEVTIEGVQNHSKVAMEKVKKVATPEIDYSEPEVIDKKIVTTPVYKKDSAGNLVKNADGDYIDEGESKATIYLYFDKDVKGNFVKQANGKYSDNEFVVKDHFTLYKGEVASRFEEKGKVVSAKYLSKDRKDVVVVNVEGLNINNRFKDHDYILEVKDFTDISSLRNKMYRYYVDFSVSAKGSDFVIVEPVKVYEDIRRGEVVATEITLTFTERMYVDRELAENPTNYIFTRSANGKQYDVKDLGGKVESQSNGNQVVITLPEWEASDFTQFEVLNNIKDKDGVRLSGPRVYDFATKKLLSVNVAPAPTTGITYSNAAGAITDKEIKLDAGTNLNTISVKLDAADAAAQTVVYNKVGKVVGTVLPTTTGVTLPAESAKTNEEYKVITISGDKKAELVIKVVDADATNSVQYKTDASTNVALNNVNATLTLNLPASVKASEVSLDDLVIDKAYATAHNQEIEKELMGNNLVKITVTPEKGADFAKSYIVRLVEYVAPTEVDALNVVKAESADAKVVTLTFDKAVTVAAGQTITLDGKTGTVDTVSLANTVVKVTFDSAVTTTGTATGTFNVVVPADTVANTKATTFAVTLKAEGTTPFTWTATAAK